MDISNGSCCPLCLKFCLEKDLVSHLTCCVEAYYEQSGLEMPKKRKLDRKNMVDISNEGCSNFFFSLLLTILITVTEVKICSLDEAVCPYASYKANKGKRIFFKLRYTPDKEIVVCNFTHFKNKEQRNWMKEKVQQVALYSFTDGTKCFKCVKEKDDDLENGVRLETLDDKFSFHLVLQNQFFFILNRLVF
jgi:hypothetical protein